MNQRHRKLLPAFALLATAALATPAVAGEVNCARPSSLEEVRACQAAKGGVDSLRQFIQRTRGIYNLYIWEYDNAVPPRVASADDDRVHSATLTSGNNGQLRDN